MPAPEPRDGRIHSGHFILRIQGPGGGRNGVVYVVEDVRSSERAYYERLEEALAFIQALFGSLLAGVFTLFAAFVYFLPALNSFVGAARAWTAAY